MAKKPMTKKEAQKLFTQMVKDTRPFIDGDTITSVSLNVHRIPLGNIPREFKKDGAKGTIWYAKSYIRGRDTPRVSIFPIQ